MEQLWVFWECRGVISNINIGILAMQVDAHTCMLWEYMRCVPKPMWMISPQKSFLKKKKMQWCCHSPYRCWKSLWQKLLKPPSVPKTPSQSMVCDSVHCYGGGDSAHCDAGGYCTLLCCRWLCTLCWRWLSALLCWRWLCALLWWRIHVSPQISVPGVLDQLCLCYSTNSAILHQLAFLSVIYLCLFYHWYC